MKKRVLLVHTGGTIGMIRDRSSGVLKPDGLYESLTRVIPELEDLTDLQVEIPFLCDSSEVNHGHWQQLADMIWSFRNKVDGVVITHGTDTLAYTASALSYMLMNLNFPVILTGAQKPLSELRSDARANLINAVELATSPVQEVSILFDNKLMRGNRTVKQHINHFEAFSSPNYPLLARVGIDIDIFSANLLKPAGLFHRLSGMDHSLAVFKLFPGCTTDSFQPPKNTRAIALIAFGAGNIPLQSGNLLKKVEQWTSEGRIVVLMSETRSGHLDPSLYEAGARLLDLGVIHSGDMTFEASITKLMFLMGQYSDSDSVKKNFCRSLAGERSD